MQTSTTWKFALGLATFGLVGAAIAFVAHRALVQLADRAASVSHTNEALLQLEGTFADLTDAETALRGYVLTEDRRFLEPFYPAEQDLGRRLARLRELTRDNPRQRQRVDSLTPIVSARLAVIQETLDSARLVGFPVAPRLIATAGGNALQDRARRLLAELESEERGQLDQRVSEHREYAARGSTGLLLALAFMAVLGALGAATIALDHRARRRAIEEILQLRYQAEDEAAKAEEAAAEAEQATEQAAAALAEKDRSERDLNDFIEHAAVGVHAIDPEGRILRANQTELRMLGVAREEYIGRHAGDYYLDGECLAELLRRLRAGELVQDYDVRLRHKDGTTRYVLMDAAAVLQDGRFVEGRVFTRDITHRRETEEKLRRVQRMESVGRLAGGVAHEVNNQMTIVMGTIDFLLRRDDLAAAARDDLAQIRRAGERSAAVTSQLLAFSRQQVLQPTAMDVNRVITEFEPVLARLLGEQNVLRLDLGRGVGQVQVDRGQLELVLVNLALNAVDVMPSGGALTIATAPAEFSHAYAGRRPELDIQAGSYSMISVTDTGLGMSAEVLERAFEPFFTTKPVGKGTGLGLSTVYGIVKQSSGYVWAYSEVMRGTTFKIYLPSMPTDEGVVPAPTAAERRLSDETLLVVEDEAPVRNMIVRTLSAEGFTVLEAGDGAEALAVLQRHPGTVHLVVTDLAMPGMTGQVLRQALEMSNPTLPVLFVSGFTDDEVARRGFLEPGGPFLPKPFSPASLVARVRELLDG